MTVDPRILRTQAEQTLLGMYELVAPMLREHEAMRMRRATAMEAFLRVGLPHRRIEAWKYTDLRARLRDVAPIGRGSDETALRKALAEEMGLAALVPARIVIADGEFMPAVSDLAGLDGVSVEPSFGIFASGGAAGLMDDGGLDPMIDLNTALALGGVAVKVAAGAKPGRPVEIVHVQTTAVPQSSFVRNAIDVGDGAAFRFVETHLAGGSPAHQANVVTELKVGDGARVKAARLQATGPEAIHVASLIATVGKRAELDHTALAAGAAVSRAQAFVRIVGEDARVGLCGVTMLGRKRHGDTLLRIIHEVPGSTSRVLFKNAVDGSATGAFQGLIVVDSTAQKTDGRMMTRTLLLSEEASFAQKPELEIYADDVQCGHGATSGRIDEEMLFYFLARGIPRPEAERLLLTAFLSEGIEALGDAQIAAALEPAVEAWLARR